MLFAKPEAYEEATICGAPQSAHRATFWRRASAACSPSSVSANPPEEPDPHTRFHAVSQLHPDAHARRQRECAQHARLQNLASALDLLMEGEVTRACDVLAQRFRAVELATQDGSWNMARHVQLVGETRVSSLSQREREIAALTEAHDLRIRTLGSNK